MRVGNAVTVDVGEGASSLNLLQNMREARIARIVVTVGAGEMPVCGGDVG
jgi:hypothetical protein